MSDVYPFDSGDDRASAMQDGSCPVSSTIPPRPEDIGLAEKQSKSQSPAVKGEQSALDYNDLLLQALQCPIPNQEIEALYSTALTPTTPTGKQLEELPPLMDAKKKQRSKEDNILAAGPKSFLAVDDVGGSFSSTSDHNNVDSPVETANSLETGRVNKKERVCHICGYEFMWPNRLRLHMRKHTNEKPLRCRNTGCNYRAKWNSGMAYHLKSHCKMAPKK